MPRFEFSLSPQPETATLEEKKFNASLGEMLRGLRSLSDVSLDELTVLSSCNDPYRLDTATNHKNAAWFRDRMEECGLLAGVQVATEQFY